MRYYLYKVAYNKVAQAEDRPQPAAYDSYDEARKNLLLYIGQSMLGETIGWVMGTIQNSFGTINSGDNLRWEDPDIDVFYGEKILAGEINSKTGEAWKVDDVLEEWRPRVADYVEAHKDDEAETA